MSESDKNAPDYASYANAQEEDTAGHRQIFFHGDEDADAPGYASVANDEALGVANFNDDDDTAGHMGEAFGYSGSIKPDPNVIS